MVGTSIVSGSLKRARGNFRFGRSEGEQAVHPLAKLSKRLRLNTFFSFFLLSFGFASQAALQFDVFLGYDGVVPEATWFPVVCEIKNDGPSFKGLIELTGAGYNQGQMQRAEVELPTGTLKRLTIPVFSTTSRSNASWDVRLLDARGKVRGEQNGLGA